MSATRRSSKKAQDRSLSTSPSVPRTIHSETEDRLQEGAQENEAHVKSDMSDTLDDFIEVEQPDENEDAHEADDDEPEERAEEDKYGTNDVDGEAADIDDAEHGDQLAYDDVVMPSKFGPDYYLLDKPPQAQWIVRRSADNELSLSMTEKRSTSDSNKDKGRRLVFETALYYQKEYFVEEDVLCLQVLDKNRLLDFAGKHLPAEKLHMLTKILQKEPLANFYEDQYFYAPSGRLHAFSFLMQEPYLCGITHVALVTALRDIPETVFRQADDIIAAKLASLLKCPVGSIDANAVRGLRESSQLWVPKKFTKGK